MTSPALAVVLVVAAWWLSTGVVLRLVWLDASTRWACLAAATGVALAAFAGFAWAAGEATVAGAYVGFGCALALWAWHELAFLLGVITGPRKAACPDGAEGWQRFRYATEALLHHEVALALTALGLAALAWGAPNQVGTATFLVLWVMRLSAKLNVFLGVRNVTEAFVPARLRYLLSYFRRGASSALLPLSSVSASGVALALAASAVAEDTTHFAAVGRTLVATLLALGVLEHVFLALPSPDEALWRWALPGSQRRADATAAAAAAVVEPLPVPGWRDATADAHGGGRDDA